MEWDWNVNCPVAMSKTVCQWVLVVPVEGSAWSLVRWKNSNCDQTPKKVLDPPREVLSILIRLERSMVVRVDAGV